jgi:hypothetical protein
MAQEALQVPAWELQLVPVETAEAVAHLRVATMQEVVVVVVVVRAARRPRALRETTVSVARQQRQEAREAREAQAEAQAAVQRAHQVPVGRSLQQVVERGAQEALELFGER